jgi:cytochrome c oxidase cbb3-type subunit 2
MPPYAFLAERDLDTTSIVKHLEALRAVGVPYSDEDIANAESDLKAQADPNADSKALVRRYPKAQARDYDGDPQRLTEMDAVVAYLQMLGTLVDVNAAKAQERPR